MNMLPLFTRSAFIAVLFAAQAHANEWGDIATISKTTAGYACTHDSNDINCAANNPFVDASGNVSVTGTISASTFLGNVSADAVTVTTTVSAAQLCDETVTKCFDLSDGITSNASGADGAVQFSASTALSSDGTNFYWDNVNKRLGIATAVPQTPLEVVGTVSTTALNLNGTMTLTGEIHGSEGFWVDNDVTDVYDDGTYTPYSRVHADSFHTNGLGNGQLFMEGWAIDGNGLIRIGAGLAGGQSAQDVQLGDNSEIYVDTSAGSVGVGTTTPSEKFHVAGNIYASGSLHAAGLCPDGISNCNPATNEAFTASGIGVTNLYSGSGGEIDVQDQINFNGNAVLGLNNITSDVTISNDLPILYLIDSVNSGTYAAQSYILGRTSNNTNHWLVGGQTSADRDLYLRSYEGGVKFYANNTQVGQFDVDGDLGIGIDPALVPIHVKNAAPHLRLQDTVNGDSVNAQVQFYGANGTRTGYIGDYADTNGHIRIVSDGGNIQVVGTDGSCFVNTGACSSDIRLKQDVEDYRPDSLEHLIKLRGVTYAWKTDPEKRHVGFIAQEVQPYFPDLVEEDEDGYLTVNYRNMVVPLVESVKELKAENDALKARLDALEAKINALQ